MKLSLVIALLCALYYSQGVEAVPDKVVCYWGSWSVYRKNNGKFEVEDIDPFKCTHLIYAFTGLSVNGSIRILDSWNEIDLGAIRRFNDLRKINPNLKTLMAMGGWNEGSITYSQVAGTAHLRTTLANNIVNFLEQYGFDGFDYDWEYPGQRGGGYYDRANFAELLRVIRERMDASGKKYLLTAAVAATGKAADISYDVPALSKYLDFINVMAYDFHGYYDGKTGQNAPLYASHLDVTPEDQEKNVAASIKAWIQRGAAPNKLVLGLGVYGRSFTLASAANNQLGDLSNGPGKKGPYTQEAGMMGYNEICEKHMEGGWIVVQDTTQRVPYMYKENQWIGYDDRSSIKAKVNFAKEFNLGGLMIWSIETDDFRGTCGPKYPILTAINEAMRSTTPQISSSPSSVKTTSASSNGGICKGEGYIRDPVYCNKFYYCSSSGDKYSFICPNTLYFDVNLRVCNYANLVEC